jgi:acetyl esterase/lipase
MIATALFGSLLIASASVPDTLATVNPELRSVATAILRAQQSAHSNLPSPRQPALPAGVVERSVPGRPGQPAVPVYVVDAAPPGTGERGAILFIHGGGYIGGNGWSDLRRLLGLADRLGCVIVSVEYRLAPETPFPGALEDNYAALKWLHANAGALRVDPKRIILLGESAGGGHAAMLAIAARDRGEVPIALQALVYPMLDDRTGSTRPAAPQNGTLIWQPADNRKGWSALLGRPAGSAQVPAGSVPARVTDLRHLPPTFIEVGSIDLFAEEDVDYARRLIGAGVPTELLVVPGAFHGFQFMVPKSAIAQQFNTALEAALSRALAAPR